MGIEDLSGQLKIPNLWYDVYARLLPGSACVGVVYYLFSSAPKAPNGTALLIGLLCGYIIGLVAQPASSRITKFLHCLVAKHYKKERLWVAKTQRELDNVHSRIVSKMHGETTFFVQCAVLGSVLLLIRFFHPAAKATAKAYLLHVGICLLFLIEAVEVADRRFRKARDEKKIKNGGLTTTST